MYSWKVTVSHSSIGCIWPMTLRLIQANSFTKNCFVQLSLLLKFWSIGEWWYPLLPEWNGLLLPVSCVRQLIMNVVRGYLLQVEAGKRKGGRWSRLGNLDVDDHPLVVLVNHCMSKKVISIHYMPSLCHSCLVVTYHLPISYLTHIQTEQLFTLIYLMWTHYSNICTSICNLHTSARL